jgi:outer membrane receptor for ferrienterochelin and colicins
VGRRAFRLWLGCTAGLMAAVPAATAAPPAPQQVLVEARLDSDSQRRLATAAMTVLGREELDAQGDLNVLDLLQRQAGLSVEGDSPRIRGSGEGETLVLINGEPAPPGFTLASLAPAQIERIEIIKGPSAEFGGTAGTINIILRGPPRQSQREWRSTLGARGARAQGSLNLGWGGRSGALGWYLPFGASHSASTTRWQALRASRDPAGVIGQQSLSGYDASQGTAFSLAPRLDWRINAQDSLQGQFFVQRNDNDNRSLRQTQALAGPPPYSVQDEASSHSRFDLARAQWQWQRRLPDGQRFEWKGSAQASLWRQAGQSQGLSADEVPRPLRDSLSSLREGGGTGSGRWRLPIGASHTLNLGLDLERRQRRELRRQFDDGVERLVGNLGRATVAQTRRETVFVQDDWAPSEGLSIGAGLRVSRSRLFSRGSEGDFEQQYSGWLPVLNLRRALDPAGRQVWRASLSRSERLPDIGLLLPRYVLNGQYDRATPNTPIAADSAGNPRLAPERSTSFELSYEHALPAGAGAASVGVFGRQIDALIRRRIGLEDVPEARVPRWVSRPVNLGRARSSGLTLEWKGRPRTGLNLRASASLYRSSVEQIDDPDARLEGQPPWTSSLGFDHELAGQRLVWGASLVLVPGFATQQSDLQRQRRGANRRLDAFLRWRPSRELELRLSGSNLLAEDAFNASSVADIDGFAATVETRRQGLASVNASLVWRF